MQRIILLFFLFSFSTFVNNNANAQIEIGVNFGCSLSSFDNNSRNYIFGPSLECRYYLFDNFAIGAHLANYSIQNNIYWMPINLTVEYHNDINRIHQPYYGIGLGMMNSKDYNISRQDPMISAILGTKYLLNDYFAINSNAHVSVIFQDRTQLSLDFNIGLVYIFAK